MRGREESCCEVRTQLMYMYEMGPVAKDVDCSRAFMVQSSTTILNALDVII